MGIVTIDPTKKAIIDREKRLAAVDAWFAAQIDAGFETADEWKLGMTQADVTLLTGNFVLAKEAAAMGLPIPPVIDTDGVAHEMNAIEELTAIMLAYGQHRANLSTEYAARRAAAIAQG
jgi:hypothetical protein